MGDGVHGSSGMPQDGESYQELPAPEARVTRAGEIVQGAVKHLGRGGFFAVVEELGWGWGIDYHGDTGFKVRFSDLQLIAFAAAQAAYIETTPVKQGCDCFYCSRKRG